MHTQQRGAGSFKAILSLVVLGAMVYVGYKLIPPYAHNYQFTEEITSIARLSSYAQGKTDEDIKQEVLAKARDLDVPLKSDDIRVQKTGTSVNIDVNYVVHVELPGYPVDLKFNPTAGNKIFVAR